jgi:hypothetical protein
MTNKSSLEDVNWLVETFVKFGNGIDHEIQRELLSSVHIYVINYMLFV